MKILFITPRFPYPPNRGDRLRYYNFAKVLSGSHELHLATLIQSKDEINNTDKISGMFKRIETVLLRPLESYRNMLLDLFSGLPLQVSYFRSQKMRYRIGKMMNEEKYDAVYVFHLRMAPYAINLKGPYKILDLTDAVSLFLKRMASHKRALFRQILLRESKNTRRYEDTIMKLFDECWIISDADKRALGAGGGGSNVFVVPNGIDTDHFRPAPLSRDEDKNIIFVGYMGDESVSTVKYFLKEIFPIVRAEVPQAKFHIVGADPPNEIIKLQNDQNIVVTGYVKDLRPFYNNANVMAAPMRFVAGVQNKILEAMAMEVPVVTSSYGNEGIDAVNGEQIFVEDDPQKTAEKIIEILMNKQLSEKMGRNARAFVREKYSWNSVVERMNKIANAAGENTCQGKVKMSGLAPTLGLPRRGSGRVGNEELDLHRYRVKMQGKAVLEIY
jgi:sugar transferase (PEP-CTERM/EpsH1 system associated)